MALISQGSSDRCVEMRLFVLLVGVVAVRPVCQYRTCRSRCVGAKGRVVPHAVRRSRRSL
eukprot:2693488-Rhodomonas_salina.1